MKSLITDLKELRRISEEVKEIGSAEEELMKDMYENLIAQKGGVGIAAPQLGVFKRIILIKDTTYPNEEPKYIYMINPKIMTSSGIQGHFEGCMSVPNTWGQVIRPYRVCAVFRGKELKEHYYSIHMYGLPAQCFGHETDHLDGIVFTDRVKDKIYEGTDEEKAYFRENNKHLLVKTIDN